MFLLLLLLQRPLDHFRSPQSHKNNTGHSQVYSVILFIIEMNRQSTFLRFVKAENLSIASLREILVLVFGVWFTEVSDLSLSQKKFVRSLFHMTCLDEG